MPWNGASSVCRGHGVPRGIGIRAVLTLLGGWLAMGATLACAGGTWALARYAAGRLEQPGRAVQQAMGALREDVAMLGGAAAELRCFALEDWATARVAAAGDRLSEAQVRQAAVAAWFEALHAIGVGVAAASALALSSAAGAPIAALRRWRRAMTVDGIAPILRALTESGRLREAEAAAGRGVRCGGGRAPRHRIARGRPSSPSMASVSCPAAGSR